IPRPSAVTREMVEALKTSSRYAPNTLRVILNALRLFLRSERNPLAEEPDLWQTPRGEAYRRRWLPKEQLGALVRSSVGRELISVALEAFNGLRSCEVKRLRARDRDMTLPEPTLRVHGKGRHGGKWRTIPMDTVVVYPMLLAVVQGKRPEDPVYPLSLVTLEKDVVAAGARIGLKVSGHALRRFFGRAAHYAGVSLVDLKNIYGHESVDMTAHYIGLDEEEMRAGMRIFSAAMEPYLKA
ncbi:MAG: site-specific integrase, partial [Thermoplasmata archaeon]|nr:site-specific integrase [Thermoplasmata archaeon]